MTREKYNGLIRAKPRKLSLRVDFIILAIAVLEALSFLPTTAAVVPSQLQLERTASTEAATNAVGGAGLAAYPGTAGPNPNLVGSPAQHAVLPLSRGCSPAPCLRRTIAVGSEPDAVAYDAAKGQTFVANFGSNNVTVISDKTDRIVANIAVGSEPVALAYDSGTGTIWVANWGSSNVSVISDSTDSVIATLAHGYDLNPTSLAYDPALGEVWVGYYTVSLGGYTPFVISWSDSSYSENAYVQPGSANTGLAYDKVKGEVFVVEGPSNVVKAISDGTSGVTLSLTVGSAPSGLAYDNTTGEVYVANSGSDNVSVISDVSGAIVKSVPTGAGTDPSGVAYASGLGEVVVADSNTTNISVLSARTNSPIGSVTVGSDPVAMDYDSVQGQVYVADYGANAVSDVVLGKGAVSPIGIPVGSEPDAVVYDTAKEETFVADYASNRVSVISDLTNRVVANVGVGSEPDALAYDSGTGTIWVANFGSNNVSVISDSTDSVVATLSHGYDNDPTSLAYDPARGEVWVGYYVVSLGGYTPFVIAWSDSTYSENAYIQPGSANTGMTYDSAKGEVFVTEGPSNVVKVISDSSNSVVATIVVGDNPTGLAYDYTQHEIFVANSHAGSVTIIADSNNTAIANISLGSNSEPTGVVDANGTGRVAVTEANSDNVTLIAAKNGSVVETLSVGLQPGAATYDNATMGLFVANTGQDRVSLLGIAPGKAYKVSFAESGLPSGTSWGVTLDDTTQLSATTSTIKFTQPDGYYTYSIGLVSGYFTKDLGNISVNGTAVSVGMTFSPSTYKIRFKEVGLTSGVNWSVAFAGVTQSTTNSTITFTAISNGTYGYHVSPISGYKTKLYSGTVTVAGRSSGSTSNSIRISWKLVEYLTKFTERGLPLGTSWSVMIDNQTRHGTGSTISFRLPNGTYAFTVSSAGYVYTAKPASPLTLNGASVKVKVTFS